MHYANLQPFLPIYLTFIWLCTALIRPTFYFTNNKLKYNRYLKTKLSPRKNGFSMNNRTNRISFVNTKNAHVIGIILISLQASNGTCVFEFIDRSIGLALRRHIQTFDERERYSIKETCCFVTPIIPSAVLLLWYRSISLVNFSKPISSNRIDRRSLCYSLSLSL